MTIMQTIFDRDGKPLGKAFVDGMTGEVQFIPRGSDEPLPRRWSSVEACKRSVLKHG
jgi:hypothetical protein